MHQAVRTILALRRKLLAEVRRVRYVLCLDLDTAVLAQTLRQHLATGCRRSQNTTLLTELREACLL